MEVESIPESQRSSRAEVSNLTHLSTTDLLSFLMKGVDEMENRYRHPANDDEKSAVFTTTLMLRSKLTFFTNTLIPKNVNLNKFTPDSKSQMELGHLIKDFQDLELNEKKKIEHFTSLFYSTCKCKNRCHFKTDYDLAYSTYRNYSQKSHDELNISVGALVKNARVSSNDKRNSGKRITYQYKMGDIQVCKEFFIAMHNVTNRQIDRYQDCVKASKAFKDKRGGNNILSQTVHDNIWKFLNQYLQSLTLPDPEDSFETLAYTIPYNKIYKDLCKHYKETFENDKPISYSKFVKFFKEKYPKLKKLKKKSDFCDECCENQTRLKNPRLQVEERSAIQEKDAKHKEDAKIAREAYVEHKQISIMNDDYVMLSIDFAENILLPSINPQPSSFYFNSRRKTILFGVSNENTGIQSNYLIDEGHSINKGPNMVISILFDYIMKKVEPGKAIVIYADNCPGQNKNQTVVAFLCYLVHFLKRHPLIQLNFMMVGHTKFSPDRHFGTIKYDLKRKGAQSIIDLTGQYGIVCQSAVDNEVIPFKDPLSGVQNFQWYEWDKYFQGVYGDCKGIRDWHSIQVHESNANLLVTKRINEPFFEYNNRVSTSSLPEEPGILVPNLLSENRRKQLAHFNKFVDEEHIPYVSGNF